MEPTQQTLDEADRVDLVYQTVLATIGASTTAEVLALWQSVPVGQAANMAATLLAGATKAILSKREDAKAFGLAYYRLARALRTGSTIAMPLTRNNSEVVSLELLRQEFEAIVAEHTGEGTTAITADAVPFNDDDSITVEVVPGLDAALEADANSSGPYVDETIQNLVDYSGNKIGSLPDSLTNGEAKAKAAELHIQHGAMLAAAGGRIAMNGSRNATNQASARDSRVIGWVRLSTTGTPCYWCAMLISRQALYKSAQSAGRGDRDDGTSFLGDGMFKFHDNCHCTAEPIYSDSGFSTNPKYAENRYYWSLWERHIKGKFGGDQAMNEWRKLIRRIRAQSQSTAAPEAA